MKRIVGLVLALAIATSVQAEIPEVLTSTDTFAVCKTLDVVTTAAAISSGVGIEANPLVAPLIANGYFPLIAVSVAMWWWLRESNNPTGTAVANVVTCGAAANNLLILL